MVTFRGITGGMDRAAGPWDMDNAAGPWGTLPWRTLRLRQLQHGCYGVRWHINRIWYW